MVRVASYWWGWKVSKIGSPSFSCYSSAAPSWLHCCHDLLNSPTSSINALPRPAFFLPCRPLPSHCPLPASLSHCRCAFHHHRRHVLIVAIAIASSIATVTIAVTIAPPIAIAPSIVVADSVATVASLLRLLSPLCRHPAVHCCCRCDAVAPSVAVAPSIAFAAALPAHAFAAPVASTFHCRCRCRCRVTIIAPSVTVPLPSHRPSSLPLHCHCAIHHRPRCTIHCPCHCTAITRLCRSRC